MKKILITGATGFLGMHLVPRLVAKGHRVRILVRPTSSQTSFEDLPVERVTGDVTDRGSVGEAIRGCDWVIHAAANLSYWGDDRVSLEQVNVEGTRNVAQLCRQEGVKRLVHVSSVAAIGIPDSPNHPANEEFLFNLEGKELPYHVSKHRAEQIILDEVARGLDAVTVNPASIFGPYRKSYRGSDMFRKVRRTSIVPYFTGGICAVHVGDVVDGIQAALCGGLAGQRYILGGENVTLRGLAEQTAAAMDLRRTFVPVPPFVTALAAMILEPWGRLRGRRPYITHVTHYCASRYHFYSSEKARRMLGYAPREFSSILDECMQMHMC